MKGTYDSGIQQTSKFNREFVVVQDVTRITRMEAIGIKDDKKKGSTGVKQSQFEIKRGCWKVGTPRGTDKGSG